MDILDFVKANWADIAGILALVIVLGERIAAVTENKTDDKVFAGIHKLLVFLKVKFPEGK